MEKLKFFKETATPGTWQPHAIYLVNPPGADFAEIYVTAADGTPVNVGNTPAITSVVNNVLSNLNSIVKVADIAARDAHAAAQDVNTIYMVVNASADPSVEAGAATYFYDDAAESFSKISEFESIEAITNWVDIVGKPNSSAAAIDTAVSQAHPHPNQTVLDQFGEDVEGQPTYNGQPIVAFTTSNW